MMKHILFCFLGILLLMPSTLFAEKVYLRCTHDVHLQNVKATRPEIQWGTEKFYNKNLCQQKRIETYQKSKGKIDVWSDAWTASYCTTQETKDIYIDESEKIFAIKENGSWVEYKNIPNTRSCKTYNVNGEDWGWCSVQTSFIKFDADKITFNKGNRYEPELCPFPYNAELLESYDEKQMDFFGEYCMGISMKYDFSGNRLLLTLDRNTSEIEHFLSIKSQSINPDGTIKYNHVRGNGFTNDVMGSYKDEFGTCRVLKKQF